MPSPQSPRHLDGTGEHVVAAHHLSPDGQSHPDGTQTHALAPTPNLTSTPTSLRAAASRRKRRRHRALAEELAAPYDGVVTLRMLLDAGLSRGQIARLIDRGTWHRAGCHTLAITSSVPQGAGLWWRALWESGRHAVLDGPTALLAAGLRGWTEQLIHVSVPNNAHIRAVPGVRHHRLRDLGPILDSELRRTRPEVAAVRSAQWAGSDAQAATLLAMTIQQRLTSTAALLARWRAVGYSARRDLIDPVVGDLCDGAQSLGELDFTRLCRERGLPAPDRQVVRVGAAGRVYLDAYWADAGLHVEIQGAHYYQGDHLIADALRANELGISGVSTITLQIPVLGLRVCPDKFLDQVARALEVGRRAAS